MFTILIDTKIAAFKNVHLAYLRGEKFLPPNENNLSTGNPVLRVVFSILGNTFETRVSVFFALKPGNPGFPWVGNPYINLFTIDS